MQTDLKYFDHIVPCGLSDFVMTSMVQEKQGLLCTEDVTRDFRTSFVDVLKYEKVNLVSGLNLLQHGEEELRSQLQG